MAHATHVGTFNEALAKPVTSSDAVVVPRWRPHEVGLLALVGSVQVAWFGVLLYVAVRLAG